MKNNTTNHHHHHKSHPHPTHRHHHAPPKTTVSYKKLDNIKPPKPSLSQYISARLAKSAAAAAPVGILKRTGAKKRRRSWEKKHVRFATPLAVDADSGEMIVQPSPKKRTWRTRWCEFWTLRWARGRRSADDRGGDEGEDKQKYREKRKSKSKDRRKDEKRRRD